MIKLIPVNHLKIGVYIHDLNCDWWSHPFAQKRFTIRSDSDLEKIRQTGLHEVYIDTERGLDVGDHYPTETEARALIEQEMRELAAAPMAPIRSELAEERSRATALHDQAHRVVREVMNDARLGRAIQVEAVESLVEGITESILRNASALLGLTCIKNKDDYTFLHCVSVCTLMVTFGQSLRLSHDAVRQGGIGGLVHDVGKALVPDAILNKPGKLTEAEFEIMKQHPQYGYDILLPIEGIMDIPKQITLRHHERIDGSGYPGGWAGEQIDTLIRMSSIVDVYDAITSNRCYHHGLPATEALRKLFEWSKHHFDAQLVQSFMRCIGIYPVGTLVRLESGKLGVVLEQNQEAMLTPIVKVFFSSKSNTYIRPEIVNLAKPLGYGGADQIVSYEDPVKWRFDLGKVLNV